MLKIYLNYCLYFYFLIDSQYTCKGKFIKFSEGKFWDI